MPQGPDALKHLAPNWFAIVMGLTGLALAWSRAAPILGDMAGAGALVLAGIAALAFVALAVLSWIRWQVQAEAVAAELAHPARHAFLGAVPVSVLLLATAGVSLFGTSAPLAALWWAGSLLQLAVTLWALGRWLRADREQGLSWAALTPVLFIPVVGNVLAPLAGVPLGAGGWAAAQFGMGVLLWPVVLALLLARIATQGLWPDRLLPASFIAVTPPALVGSGALQLGASPVLAWMAWGVALLMLLWCAPLMRRILAQPFGIGFWALGFPLAAFAALTLRLAFMNPAAQMLAVVALALASLVVLWLALASWKSWRQGTLLAPEAAPVKSITASRGDRAP